MSSQTATGLDPANPVGLLVIDKPRGMSSHTVVQHVRRLYHLRKVGHAGTLDPEATGVMVVALGSATRLLEYYLDQRKTYVADLALGKTSTTGDAEGEITETFLPTADSPWPTREHISQILDTQFLGEITQVPPAYSALKQGGEPLYKKARRGEVFEIPERTVHIFSLALQQCAPPLLRIEVACSKGTYIRTLAEDIGTALQTGAYLTALRRTASGQFSIDQAHTLDQLEEMSSEEKQNALLPLGYGLQDVPSVVLTDEDLFEIQNGRDIALPAEVASTAFISESTGQQELLVWETIEKDTLLAVIEQRANGLWKPRKVFVTV